MKPYQYLIAVILFFVGVFMFSEKAVAAPGPNDEVYLHYDCAPDPDDIHAIAAGRLLTERLGVTPNVIIGTHGDTLGDRYLSRQCNEIATQAYGNDYRDVGNNHSASSVFTAQEWDAVIARGGRVFVAEGGPSDYTFDVLQRMTQDTQRVTIVQHSAYNEMFTNAGALNSVRNNTQYIRIDDGNQSGNGTADFRDEFTTTLRNQIAGEPLWTTAVRLFGVRLDFSDTVEVLRIFDIGLDQVSGIPSFLSFIDGPAAPAPAPAVTQVGASVITIQAENFETMRGVGDKTWVTRSELGETGIQLLPDTRVTANDRLISGVNFWDLPGAAPETTYTIDVQVGGEYRVEVRALSRGSEDNGAHVGVNGDFSGATRVQWCQGRGQWTYSSAIRTATNHCGVPDAARAILSAGSNTITLQAREDGLFVDEIRFIPLGVTVAAPAPTPAPAPVQPVVASTTGQCAVTGNSLGAAVAAYEQQCALASGNRDCDPVNGVWFCGNFNNPRSVILPGGDTLPPVAPAPTPAPAPAPVDTPTVQICVAQVCQQVDESTANEIRVILGRPVVDDDSSATVFRMLDLPISGVLRTPTANYADSYSYMNKCYISSGFDHGAGDLTIGGVNARTIAANQNPPVGIDQADAIYNDINCGNGPANTAGDEDWCPGRVDSGITGCLIAGPDIRDQL